TCPDQPERCYDRLMTEITGFSGSLRKGSFNAALLRAAASSMPDGSSLTIGTIRGIPLYDADEEEASGIPPTVNALKAAIVASDGLLIVTPEYNNSIPGVTKNAIDWLSRPPADIARIFGNRPVAIMGASPGGFGTILSQNAWLPVLSTLGARHWTGGRLLMSRAHTLIDANGNLTDEAMKAQVAKFMAGFVDFVKSTKGK
ncbi:MAG: NADPH-dependent reductase, partial [Rhodospirillales bacterium]|nr:NADPH-dependent reductase [Rhodospirillales bacterium]